MATKIDVAVAWAAAIANDESHGYDQDYRWGPDYDCSSLVISAWEAAGVPVKSKYGAERTGNMYSPFIKAGFVDVTKAVNLKTGAGTQKGDVWLYPNGHTEMMFNSTHMVGAHSNENKQTTGGQTGDQTGHEIDISPWHDYSKGWKYVLRYPGGHDDFVIDKSQVTSGNFHLTVEQRNANGVYIAAMLLRQGWTLNAISAILANMQYESGCNSGIWENLDEGNMNRGFGLTQWTPAQKLFTWAEFHGIDAYDIDTQISRLVYEMTYTEKDFPEDPVPQYLYDRHPSMMTREEFVSSTEDPYYLAAVFGWNYERSDKMLNGTEAEKEEVRKERGEAAEVWYTYLSGLDLTHIGKHGKRLSRLLFLAMASD